MRKEDLHHTLMHPENLSDDQLRELSDMVVRFPFFGAAQIALTRAFKARGDVRFTDQLSQAAIYTGHRASLYTRLKSIKPTSQPHVELLPNEIQLTVEPTLASIILEDEASVQLAPTEKISYTVALPQEAIEQPQSPAELPIHDQVSAVEENDVAPGIKMSELEPLEAQFLVAAVNTSIELEVQPEPSYESNEPADPTLDEELLDENSYAALIYRRAQRKHLLPEENASIEFAHEAELDQTEELPAFRSTPLSHGVQRIRSTDSKQHQRDLIDRFIHSEPQIARGKASEYQPGNLAKDSLEEDFSFVTETMAVLFAKQGKLDKARKAFRKLMEQHPEKSVYFAAQLKNLEHFKK
jgi:hypothetical protein